jgi:hypothetical protein
MKKILFFFLLTVSLNAAAQYQLKDFKPLHGLAKVWEIKSDKGALVEQWVLVNDSLMRSSSYMVNGKDTIPEETIELKLSDGKITFTPIVPNQNEGKPLIFTLISIAGTKFTFENKLHDFPQQIAYHIMEKELHVTISGNTKNGFMEIPYEFVIREQK